MLLNLTIQRNISLFEQPEIFAILCDNSSTILELKTKIQEFNGIPATSQQLIIASTQNLELENEKHLTDYDIKDNTTIALLSSSTGTTETQTSTDISLCIKVSQEFWINIKETDTVQDLKDIILKNFNNSQNQHSISHAGNLLINNEKTLQDYSIKDKNSIDVLFTNYSHIQKPESSFGGLNTQTNIANIWGENPKTEEKPQKRDSSFSVTVKSTTGKSWEIYGLNKNDTLESLYNKIASKVGTVTVKQIRLIYGGMPLNFLNKSLDACEIGDGSTLHLMIMMR